MRLTTKLAIFLVAFLLTLVGFNLIASIGAVDIVKVGKRAGYEIITNFLAKANAIAQQSSAIKG